MYKYLFILFIVPLSALGQNSLNDSTDDYFNFYQKYISEIRPISCPMYPSCSYYAKEVINDKGIFQGLSLTADRLIRDGHDAIHYDLTLTENGFKVLDIPFYKDDSKYIYTGNKYSFSYGDEIWDQKEISFVKNLINNGFYREALLEINRINFFKPSLNTAELFINKIICYKALNEFEKAIFEYETNKNLKFKNNLDLVLNISKIYVELDNLPKSLEMIDNSLESKVPVENLNDLLELKGYILAKKGDLAKSLRTFESMKELDVYPIKAESHISIINKTISMKQKNPTLAGILSVIPGAGYYYTGNKQTALSSLIINSLLFYATYNNVSKENYGMAALTGIFNLAFYIGNIQGSVLRAKKVNEINKNSNLNNIKRKIRF